MRNPFLASSVVGVGKVFADARDGFVEEMSVQCIVPVAVADVCAAVARADDDCWSRCCCFHCLCCSEVGSSLGWLDR